MEHLLKNLVCERLEVQENPKENQENPKATEMHAVTLTF